MHPCSTEPEDGTCPSHSDEKRHHLCDWIATVRAHLLCLVCGFCFVIRFLRTSIRVQWSRSGDVFSFVALAVVTASAQDNIPRYVIAEHNGRPFTIPTYAVRGAIPKDTSGKEPRVA